VGSGAELDRGGKFAAWDGDSNPNIREVVAFPVFNAGGKVIAVLTAVSDQQLGLLSTPAGEKYHRDLSVDVGRVLVEILGYKED